jgi:hypothetical protein
MNLCACNSECHLEAVGTSSIFKLIYEAIWFSGLYCRAFGPPEKGRVQKVAGVERRSAQGAHLQVKDRADFSLRMRATPQLTRLSDFQSRTDEHSVRQKKGACKK